MWAATTPANTGNRSPEVTRLIEFIPPANAAGGNFAFEAVC
jgi:hypothetical protein